MDQKHFDMLIKYIEDVACGFRGHAMSEEQFNQVDALWNDFRNCYTPCRPQPESVTNMQLSEEILAEIQKEYDQDVVDGLAGWTVDFEQKTISPKERVCVDEDNGIAGTDFPIGTAECPVNNLADAHRIVSSRGFFEDECGTFHFFPNFEITHKEEDLTCTGKGSRVQYLPGGDIDRYNKAMKVVK